MKSSWVILDIQTTPWKMKCNRCFQWLDLPNGTLDGVIDVTKMFYEKHRACAVAEG